MNYQQLTVTKPQENGAIYLSDGAKYLIVVEDQPVATRWQAGQLIHITAIPSRPEEFELSAGSAPCDSVRAKRVLP